MNQELWDHITTFLHEAEASEDIIVIAPELAVAKHLGDKIEGLYTSTFTSRELAGIRTLISEAIWGASAFYDREMEGTLVGLSKSEFEDICLKLGRAID